ENVVEPNDDPFHLLRGDVDTAALDHVLDPVTEEQVAVGVDADDVAGAQPAAAEHLRRAFGIVEITQHDRRGPADQLAGPDVVVDLVAYLDILLGDAIP